MPSAQTPTDPTSTTHTSSAAIQRLIVVGIFLALLSLGTLLTLDQLGWLTLGPLLHILCGAGVGLLAGTGLRLTGQAWRARAQLIAPPQRATEQRRRLLRAAEDLLATTSYEATRQQIWQVLQTVFPDEWSGFYWLDAEHSLLFPVHIPPAQLLSEDIARWSISLGKGILGEVTLSGRSELINNAHHDPRSFYPPGAQVSCEHMIAVPIHARAITFGVIVLCRWADPPFSDDDFELAQLIGRYAALALSNTQLLTSANMTAERYRSLVDTAGSMIVCLSPDRRILEFNREAERATGWRRDEVLGRDYFELFLPEEEQAAIDANIAHVLAGTPTYGYENLLRMRNGDKLSFLWNVSRILDNAGQPSGIIAIGQEISARKQAEAQLHASEWRYRHLLEQAADAILVSDTHGRCIEANARACALLGYSRDEMLALRMIDIIDPDDLVKQPAILAGMLPPGQTQTIERRYRRKDGSVVPAESKLCAIDDSAVMAVVRDLTERYNAEEERIAFERRLLELQKLESLGVLAGGIAHEFNNLLATMLANAELALHDLTPDSPLRELIAPISEAARRASFLTRQMLAYSGKGHFLLEQIDLQRLLATMTPLLQATIAGPASLQIVPSAQLPPVAADAGQLRQLVLNLALNAAEAIGDQPGAITLSTAVQTLSAAELPRAYLAGELESGEYVLLTVRDSGQGMDEATQARMFEPFFTTKFTGRGLGLAAVLGIVRGHKGAIAVASAPATGTTVTVLLPVARQEMALLPVPLPTPTLVAAANGAVSPQTVLVVDDEASVCSVVARLLRRLQIEVLTAQDGSSALAIFQDHADSITGVLLDVTMPDIDGIELLRRMSLARPGLPIVLMSGYSEHEIIARCDGIAPAGFLQKPFSPDDVRRVVSQRLDPAVLRDA